MQADRLAAFFLTPRHLFFPALEFAGEGLTAIEGLAILCKTSLHATAIRFAQCTRELAAIVASTGSRIDHCFMSEALKTRPESSGCASARRSRAARLRTRSTRTRITCERPFVSKASQPCSSGSAASARSRLAKMSSAWAGYGKTLTVLYGISFPDAEAEETRRR
jgi:hypothetical protein